MSNWYENFIRIHRNNNKLIYNYFKIYGKEVLWLKLNDSENKDINIKKYSLISGQSGALLSNNHINYKFYTHYVVLPLSDMYFSDSHAPSEINDVLIPLSDIFNIESSDKIIWNSLGRSFEYIIKTPPQSIEGQLFKADLTLIRSYKDEKKLNIDNFRSTSDNSIGIDSGNSSRITKITIKE